MRLKLRCAGAIVTLACAVCASPAIAETFKVVNQSSAHFSSVTVSSSPGVVKQLNGLGHFCQTPTLEFSQPRRIARGETLSFDGTPLGADHCYRVVVVFEEGVYDGIADFVQTAPVLVITDSLIDSQVQGGGQALGD